MIKILAINDRNDNLISLEAIIKDAFRDSTVFTALNGPKGIELAVSENPDVILMDIVMAGIDGIEICRRLKQDERVRDIPVIFLTTINDNKRARIEALEAGAEGFLVKPVDETELIAQVRAMIKIKAANEQKFEHSQKTTLNALHKLQIENDASKKIEEALIWTSGPDMKCDYFNQPWLNFTGRSLDQELGDGWTEGLHPDDLQQCVETYTSAFEARKKFTMEYRILHSSGEYRWIQDVGSPRYNSKGEFAGYIGHCLDITECKLAEESLAKNYQLLHDMIDNSSSLIYMMDTNNKYLSVNLHVAKLLGKTPAEIIGKTREEFIPKKIAEKYYLNDLEVINKCESTSFEEENLESDGKHIYFTVKFPLLDSQNKPYGIAGISTDTTALRQAEQKYEILFREMPDGFALHEIICNEQGEPVDYRFLAVNPAFERQTGLKAEQILGKTALDILPDLETYWIETYGRVALTGEPVNFENYSKDLSKFFDVKAFCPAPNQFVSIFSDTTERKLAVEQLRKSEEKYHSIFENIQDVYYETSLDGIIMEVSPSIEIISKGQFCRDEVIGRSMYDYYVNKEERESIISILQEKGSVTDFEVTLINKDGSYIFCAVSAKLWYDSHGLPEKILGSMHDITERKHTEEKVRLNAERLARMVNIYQYNSNNVQDFLDYTLNEAIELTSSKFGYIYLYNKEKKKFILNSWSKEIMKERSVISPQNCYELSEIEIWGEAVRQRKEIIINNFKETNLLKKDYSQGHLQLEKLLTIPIFDADKIVAVVGVANKENDYDSTDLNQLSLMMNSVWRIVKHKEAEEHILRLNKVIEQSTVSIIITDSNGTLEYVNPKFAEVTGYSSEEAIGRNPRFLQSGETSKEEYKKLWDTILSGKEWHGEFYNKKKSGEFYWEKTFISPIINQEGGVTHFVAVSEDITEKKKMVENLILAKERAEESDRLKTAFLHNISHEIRTPMNAIVGFADLLNDPELLPEESKKFTEIIIQNSNQLLSIITDLVNIATIEAGQEKVQEKEININSICRLVYEQFLLKAEKQKITLILKSSIPDSDSRIITDETKLVQILTNLLSNAIKFTERGSVTFGYELKNNNLEFYVKDTGIGIPSEKQDEIFKRFRQLEVTENRQYGGSGLGLSISKIYVELLGGKMWISSMPGKGSTFYFTIPYKAADARQ